MAATSLSSIATPSSSSSSSSSLSPLYSDHYSFTHFSPNFASPKPKPYKTLSLTLTLKSHNSILSPLLPLHHLCHSSSDFNDTIADELDKNPDEEVSDGIEQDKVEEDDELGFNSGDDCRVCVGNLPYSMTSSQLAEIFAEAGHVRNCEIIYDKVTDRSRGFGFVTMGSMDEAREAIRMFDGSQVGGRTVKVNFPEVPRGGERKVMGPKIRSTNQSFVDTPHEIYAGNLGWGITSQGLGDAFVDQPGFLTAKVIYERETGRSRGFGFISFSSAEAAESALQAMNGIELDGRPLRLNMAANKTRSNTGAYGERSEVLSTVSS